MTQILEYRIQGTAMSAKRQRLPLIEAFILTGLLVDLLSQVEHRLETREPMRVAQTTCITLQSSLVKTLVKVKSVEQVFPSTFKLDTGLAHPPRIGTEIDERDPITFSDCTGRRSEFSHGSRQSPNCSSGSAVAAAGL
ncbi:MAG TPA: hypothetical protein V6D35_14370 [Candidatus Sericytochromatia bacterium]